MYFAEEMGCLVGLRVYYKTIGLNGLKAQIGACYLLTYILNIYPLLSYICMQLPRLHCKLRAVQNCAITITITIAHFTALCITVCRSKQIDKKQNRSKDKLIDLSEVLQNLKSSEFKDSRLIGYKVGRSFHSVCRVRSVQQIQLRAIYTGWLEQARCDKNRSLVENQQRMRSCRTLSWCLPHHASFVHARTVHINTAADFVRLEPKAWFTLSACRRRHVEDLSNVPIQHAAKNSLHVERSFFFISTSVWLVIIVCLASSVGQSVSRSDACSLMCAGGPGSIPGADKLDSGFHPYG